MIESKGLLACRTIVGCQCDIHDRELMCSSLKKAVHEAGGHIIGKVRVQKFPNGGLTVLAVLRESSVSLHTYKECDNSIAIDAFTCGEECHPLSIIKNLASILEAREITDEFVQIL